MDRVCVFALYLEGFECFCVLDDGSEGKGGEIVVNTTDLCTLNLIATLAPSGKKHVCRYKVKN